MAHPASGRVQFGSFDFNPATGELRRNGDPVRLQPQPAQVLACLLAKPGEVVTREELRHAVWGEGTFVDFDRSLNFCIAQIRSALGDPSDGPLYIKTVPKRGYQFIAPVSSPPMPPRAPRRKGLILAGAVVTVIAIFLLLPHKVQTDPTRIAVARFDNLSGDPDFDRFTDALTNAVVGEVTTWGEGKYAVIGNATILREPRSRRDLLAIHSSLQVGAVILGDVQRSPDGIQVFAQLIGLPGQEHRKAIRIRTAEPDPVKAQAELAKRILAEFAQPLTFAANP